MILNKQSGALLPSLLDPAEEGAGEVLNDFFEEHGQPRVIPEEFDFWESPARLAFVLDQLLPADVAKMLACDFAEHALEKSGMDDAMVRRAEDLLEMQRKFLIESRTGDAKSTSAAQKRLNDEANALFGNTWNADNTSQSRGAWAVWAVVTGKPSNVAVSAQAVDDGQLDWQLQHLVAEITRISNDVSNETAK